MLCFICVKNICQNMTFKMKVKRIFRFDIPLKLNFLAAEYVVDSNLYYAKYQCAKKIY